MANQKRTPAEKTPSDVHNEAPQPAGRDVVDRGFPKPGDVLKRLRTLRGMSLRDVAHESGLSQSFLGALERGESDIALERLAQLARVFGHNVGSFLGYSPRQAKPYFLSAEERISVDRGPGVDYQIVRVPGTGLELVLVKIPPRTALRDEPTHEGVDVVVVTQGVVTVRYDDQDFSMQAGECVMWSGGLLHSFRNDTRRAAEFVCVVTASVY